MGGRECRRLHLYFSPYKFFFSYKYLIQEDVELKGSLAVDYATLLVDVGMCYFVVGPVVRRKFYGSL